MTRILLTEADCDVLELLADGHDKEEIARRLGVPRGALEGRLREMLCRLGVHVRPALAVQAVASEGRG